MNHLFWLGGEASFNVYQMALRKIEEFQMQHGLGARPNTGAQLRAGDDDDNRDDPFNGFGDMVTLVGDVAVIQVAGMLVPQGYGEIGRWFGITGYDEIRNAMVEVANSGLAKSVLFDVRTSGGSAAGIGEFSDFAIDFKKIMPIDSFTGVEALSAGQWIYALGNKCYASKMASVGSIGVISVYMDRSEYLKNEGIKPVVIRSGTEKALGNGLEEITPEVQAKLQARSDRYHDFFKDHMSSMRGISGAKLTDMCQGQVFFAVDAVAMGLVDEIKSFDDVVINLNARHTSTHSASGGNMKRQLNSAGLAAVGSGTVALEAALKDPLLSTEVSDEEETKPEGDDVTPPEGDDVTPPEGDTDPAPTAKDTGAGAQLMDRLETLMTEKVALKADVAASAAAQEKLQEKLDAALADVASLRGVVAPLVGNLQVALGMSATTETIAAMSAGDLVKTHTSLVADMGKRYPVGPQGTRGDGSKPAEAGMQSGMQAAVQVATKLNVVK